MTAPTAEARAKISRTVKLLGVVSFLTDVSSDMITPLLPIFLKGTLGASFGFIGIVDGAADTVSSLLKIVAGRLSDRAGRRKPLTVAGYGLASVARPLVAIAMAPWHVLLIRVTDRVGKGLRTAPRDAWIAEATPAAHRGRAYGFHRAMDNLGAFLGPLVGYVLYRVLDLPLRIVFALAAIPGLIGVLVIVLGLRERSRSGDAATAGVPTEPASDGPQPRLPLQLKLFLGLVFVFSLANASDFFLVLKAKATGFDDGDVLWIWAGLSGLRALLSTPGSLLSDRWGRYGTLLLGWLVFGAVYVGFSYATAGWHVLVLFAVYAAYYGLTEGVERALVADLAPASRRGLAFGLFHGAIGLAALPANWAFGAISDLRTMELAFRLSGGLALVAAIGLVALVVARRQRPTAT